MVHSIMRHVAETTGQDLEQLYGQIGWPLYKLYGHAFEAFKQMVQDPEPIFARLQVCSSPADCVSARTVGSVHHQHCFCLVDREKLSTSELWAVCAASESLLAKLAKWRLLLC